MIDFNKATFDNTFNAMVMLQEQSERAANALMGQATWLPEDVKNAINEWVKAYKKGREDFKKLVGENFQKVLFLILDETLDVERIEQKQALGQFLSDEEALKLDTAEKLKDLKEKN
jgi:hypothetical protein